MASKERASNPLDSVPRVDESTLVCQTGDRLEVVTSITSDDGLLVQGSVYEAIDRRYYGWDFKLVEGTGPTLVRILNSQVLTYMKTLS